MSVLHDPSHFVSRVLRLDKDQRLHCNVSIQRLDYFKEEEDIEVWEGCYDNSLRAESFIFAMGGVYFSFSCLLVFTLLVQTATSLLCKVFFVCVCVCVLY